VGDLTSADKFYGIDINSADLTAAAYYVAQAELLRQGIQCLDYRLLVSPSSLTGAAASTYGAPYQDWIIRIPEPGVLTLLGIGLVVLGITRRRTK